ncbi:sodium:calcium antiporter [Chloroflexota bacterium]
MVWLKFFLCVVIVLFSGSKLARYGDAIAEKTGLGRMWIGLVLIAAITSMPELVTGVSAAALVKLPDLALGTILGSCFFNLSILALLDLMYRRTPVLSKASRGHVLSAGLGILLMAVVALSILGGERFDGLALGWVGLPSFLILIFYLVGARRVFLVEKKKQILPSPVEPPSYGGITLKIVYLRFALAALAVIGAGIWLSFVGDELSVTYNWSASFVGSMFLAITTSLPELVVAITAVRIGAVDMAVADILGANMLDIVGIFLADIFYTRGPILFQPRSLVAGTHIITALVAIAMTLVVILGLRFQQKHKTFVVVSWYGPLLIGLYIFGAYVLFTSGISLG